MNTVKIESWKINRGTVKETKVNKIAVRNEKGQFHGSTNFRGTILK